MSTVRLTDLLYGSCFTRTMLKSWLLLALVACATVVDVSASQVRAPFTARVHVTSRVAKPAGWWVARIQVPVDVNGRVGLVSCAIHVSYPRSARGVGIHPAH